MAIRKLRAGVSTTSIAIRPRNNHTTPQTLTTPNTRPNILTSTMVSLTTLLALSAGALASPVLQDRQIAIPENWNWHVSGWSAGCSRSGCSYNFNVTVPSVEGQILGVKAYCNGYENGWYRKGNWFDNCQILEGVNNGVAAKFSERESDVDGSPKEIILSFTLAGYEDR